MANNARGILMFAHNNQEIDYIKLAIVNALSIQKHLGLTTEQITIVTDSATLDYAGESLGTELVEKAAIYQVVKTDVDFKYKNQRIFKDTYFSPKVLPFYNVNRADAYELSPYTETILIDVDYLILSDSLNNCWNSNNDIMMNWEFQDVCSERTYKELDRLDPLGITMYWATVVYFKKTTEAETFFNIVRHVRDNRKHYNSLYKFNDSVYRNDFSFSIAAHMLSGFKDKGLAQLPFKLYKTFDADDIYKARGERLYFYLEKPKSPGDFMLAKWSGIDVHIMNKWAFNRISDHLLNVIQNEEMEDYDSILKRDVPVVYDNIELPNVPVTVLEDPMEIEPVHEEPEEEAPVEFTNVNDALAAFKAMQEAKKKAKEE